MNEEVVALKKVDKICKNCFHCRMRVSINMRNIFSTMLSPVSRREGLVLFRCRKGYWCADVGVPEKMLYLLSDVEKLRIPCIYFEGEDDEERHFTTAV